MDAFQWCETSDFAFSSTSLIEVFEIMNKIVFKTTADVVFCLTS